jgi:serine/threonine-protein kinase
MATVHLGRLLGPVGFSRTVAIKRLHDNFAQDPQFVAMFLDEARIAARIRHPNVCGTLDVVALKGELFLVMEFLQGESLSGLLRSAFARDIPVAPSLVASILVDALDGLHAAHVATDEHGQPLNIVHRDISPQNIFVGVDGIARVLDFGIAKAAGRVQTTGDGQLKGKLAYMPPEQIRGAVCQASDTYAAAVVLWEALAVRRLFGGDHPAEVLDSVLHMAIPPPSTHAPGLSPELDALVLRGLDRDPAARFTSAREMARELERIAKPQSRAAVGAWVEEVAKESISHRAASIARIESSSKDLPRPITAEGVLVSAVALPPPAAVESAPRPSERTVTSVEQAPLVTARPAAKSRSRLVRATPILVSAILGAGVVFAGTRLRPHVVAASAAATSASAGPVSGRTESGGATVQPEAPAVSVLPAVIPDVAGDTAIATAASATASAPPRSARPRATLRTSSTARPTPASPSAAPAGKNCTTVDSAGILHVKPECL